MGNLDKLLKLMDFKELDLIILGGQPNISYFIGVPKPSGCLLIGWKDGYIELLTPLLDYDRVLKYAEGGGVRVVPYATYKVDPTYEVVPDPVSYVKSKVSRGFKVGTDLGYINFTLYRLISSLGGENVVNVTEDILKLRSIKDEVEVDSITNALRITEDALTKVLNELRPGMTELEIVGLLEDYLRRLGAEGTAFDTIVASGRNSAYPHALPSSKVMGDGDHLVIDVGAIFRSYCSDITRTVFVGGAPDEVPKLLDAVIEALEVAEDYVGPYVKVSDVDSAVRKVLSRYGYDRYFIHSSGHGVGIEVHEHPRIARGVDAELVPGMVVTLEPGVYLRDLCGVRVEDMVFITSSGRKVLNRLSHRI